ncbi:hypothetical protein HNQ02_002620 [Flavobacterium sp. 7E]|nr:hypothetical protein [Flavobacterium sp. 7E]
MLLTKTLYFFFKKQNKNDKDKNTKIFLSYIFNIEKHNVSI